jgi:hypothetical protein
MWAVLSKQTSKQASKPACRQANECIVIVVIGQQALCVLVCMCVRLPGVEPRCTYQMEGRDTPQPLLGREGPAVKLFFIYFLFHITHCVVANHWAWHRRSVQICGTARTPGIVDQSLVLGFLNCCRETSTNTSLYTHGEVCNL